MQIKVIAGTVAALLTAIAVADIPSLNAYDAIVSSLATLLVGWTQLRRPGDTAP